VEIELVQTNCSLAAAFAEAAGRLAQVGDFVVRNDAITKRHGVPQPSPGFLPEGVPSIVDRPFGGEQRASLTGAAPVGVEPRLPVMTEIFSRKPEGIELGAGPPLPSSLARGESLPHCFLGSLRAFRTPQQFAVNIGDLFQMLPHAVIALNAVPNHYLQPRAVGDKAAMPLSLNARQNAPRQGTQDRVSRYPASQEK
jgi:hypothetical protein